MAIRIRGSTVVAMLVAVLLSSLVAVPAIAADEPAYWLPAPEGTELAVSQGNDHPSGRRASERYAYDFVSGPGSSPRFPVTAARGGTVISQRLGIRGGRCNTRGNGPRPDCWVQVNHVLIDHGDGTSGLYMHLRPQKATVQRGDVVAAGQRLGSAGQTGWTNEVGVQFQLQRTPAWDERTSSGWFQTASLPLSFSDPAVLDVAPDGVPLTDDVVVSGNADPIREPFRFRRRPVDLPALVPLQSGEDRDISGAYDADSPDGYGLHFAPAVVAPDVEPPDTTEPTPDPLDPIEPPFTDPGTAVRPLFGGDLVYAGCGTGVSESLGRMVVIRRSLDDGDHFAVHGHLSDIDPLLLDTSPDGALQVGPNDVLGHYGVILAPDLQPALDCSVAEADADPVDLFAGILLDASVSSEGEILGGTPLSPEPLIGRGGYEGFAGWQGQVRAVPVADESGRPRVNWNPRTPAHSSHIPYGDKVQLAARVRNSTEIQEVRFRVYYPRWARVRSSHQFDGFDPKQTWRQVAICRPPGASGVPPRKRGCDWDGDATDAVVSFLWDPLRAEAEQAAPWLPRERAALGPRIATCVPASLLVEVVDTAGHVATSTDTRLAPARCDQRGVDRNDDARVIYLDPLSPPVAPVNRGRTDEDRPFPHNERVFGPDPLNGFVAWRDRANNEDGYYVYVRRNWLLPDCSLATGNYVRVATLPPDAKRYKPRHQRNLRAAPAPDIPDVPGFMTRYQMYVSAFNEVGESDRVLLAGFIAGGEAFCDAGLEPPPDL